MRLALVLAAALLAGCGGSAPEAQVPPSPAPPVPSPPPAVTSPPAPVPTPVPVLDWQPCEAGFECAVLPVELGDTGQVLDLAVTRTLATGERVGSLVVNPGGPGSSAVDYLQAAVGGFPPDVRAAFDLVALDPRGVGRSAGVTCLDTAGLDAYYAVDPTPDDDAELSELVAATGDFVDGCVAGQPDLLPHVSTTEAALDLDLLRRALGDEQLTYLGYSYGTAIGAAYVEAFPGNVRAMVLDGGIDPTLTWDQLLEGQSGGFDLALAAFLADCEQVGCAFREAVQGDLLAAYDALVARVDGAPLPADGRRVVGPSELSLGVAAGLYSELAWPAIAQGLAEAVRGEGSTLLALSDSYTQRGPEGYSTLLEANVAVNCIDRPWPRDTEPYLALADRVRATAPRFGPAIALSGLSCAQWPVEPVRTPGPVTGAGSAPVLVVGTTRDPATPYAWSVALADQLEAGVLMTHDGDGHTVYRLGAPDCVVDGVGAYLVAGVVPTDLDC